MNKSRYLSVRILVIIPQLLLPLGAVPILRDVSVILGLVQITGGRSDSSSCSCRVVDRGLRTARRFH